MQGAISRSMAPPAYVVARPDDPVLARLAHALAMSCARNSASVMPTHHPLRQHSGCCFVVASAPPDCWPPAVGNTAAFCIA